jgi:hypothetical protein
LEGWGEADEPKTSLTLAEIKLTERGLRAVLAAEHIPNFIVRDSAS